ncbi:Hsp20/alpha crystallin family protein [Sphingobium agri]|uniref:Hsp20/alpha crystallin family protein n=1 Tax=Sphingobium agri TaxID=2933566 RepID=A0ABT0DZG9_9SPHN|nr:Hsp20/alpha crystallin family protein [Sphingobium agri]MCK0532521.1 Hsp20/alpha crystallin family protein [Sphingobium agri]
MASHFMTPFGGRGLLNRGDPFLDLHREVNRLFDDSFRAMGSSPGGHGTMMGMPRIDVHEAGDKLEITAELPGVAQEDVDLRLEGEMLIISGEKRREHEDKQAHILERSYGAFSRSIQLPFQPDPDQVHADFNNGVLKISLPRQGSQERSRRIQIGNGQIGNGQGGQVLEGRSGDPGGEAGAASQGQQGGGGSGQPH